MKEQYSKLTFLTIVAVLLFVSFLTYRNVTNYMDLTLLIRHSNRVLLTAETVFSYIKDAETSQRGYHLTGDSLFLEPYNNSIKVLPHHIKILDSLLAQNSYQLQRIDTLNNLINNQFRIIARTLISAHDSSDYTINSRAKLLMEGKSNMTMIRNLMTRIISDEQRVFEDRVSSEDDYKNLTPIALLIYTLISIGAALLLFLRMIDALRRKSIVEEQLKENLGILKKEVETKEFAQTLLRNILDNSLDGIMAFKSIRSADQKIQDFEWLMANRVGTASANVKEGSLTGKRLLKEMPENKEQGLFDVYAEVVESGKPAKLEKFYSGNGWSKWFTITAVKLRDGFVVTFSDISEQKQQTIALEEREVLLIEAEALAKMGSWKWIPRQNKIIWSAGLYAILSTPPGQEPSWASVLDNVSEEDRRKLLGFLETITFNKVESEVEYYAKVNGQLRCFNIIAKPQKGDISGEGQILGLIQDITDQKENETKMKQYNDELKRSNEDLEQFAYVASHDLQEPLRKIRAFGDRLSGKYQAQLDDTGEDYIKRMQAAASRMQVLIEDLLTFSQVSRNMQKHKELKIITILKEVIDDLEEQMRRENATIEIGKIPTIQGEYSQVKRLFQNLINNAIKFHKKDVSPRVTIKGQIVSNLMASEFFPVSLASRNYVMITVEDNGIGFQREYSEKIFNIFQRLHGRLEYEGTGIGLSICRKIMSNHQGYITARSEFGFGSRFILIFPTE